MKLSHANGVHDPITQPTESSLAEKRRGTARALRLGALLVSSTTLLLACGPHGGGWSDGEGADDVGGGGIIAASGGADAGGPSAGGAAVGGATYVCDPQPQQTYVCAGYAYENEAAGAAELVVYPDYCGEQGGTGGYWSTGGAGTGGGYYYGGEGGYETGGWTSAGGAVGVGGSLVTEGERPDPPLEPLEDIGYGGAPDGAGGSFYYPPTSGGADAGGGPSTGPAKWCDTDPVGTVVGGISFAVGSCQDVDVALPLLLKEPYYGAYTARIYGSSSACDRAVLLSTVAGIGTGQVLEVPFRTEGYSFISVEVQGDRYSEFALRLRDRPRVVPSPGE
jgi:hypothetical protein